MLRFEVVLGQEMLGHDSREIIVCCVVPFVPALQAFGHIPSYGGSGLFQSEHFHWKVSVACPYCVLVLLGA